MTNRLAHETSPYLLQHAHNPVDWFPWGEEALRTARRLERPIFLSIGYSACHWCHVMERESFEDPDTAAVLNEHFVNIKVDREERPDLDETYMQAVQMFTGGHGGWPMSVFLTPERIPFFGGTYFPPADRHGMPSFKTVLRFVSEAWRERRGDVDRTTAQVSEAIRRMAEVEAEDAPPGHDVLESAFQHLRRSFDAQNGGFGGAPKFPPAMALSFLLRWAQRHDSEDARLMIETTLRKMAQGGIHDHLGGGFHRYATDAHWLVPHFEKMLYDNALLARVYLEAYQAGGDAAHAAVVRDILDYVAREMIAPEGGFATAQDADSDGAEGKYFVWTPDEIAGVVGGDDARILCAYFDVTPAGNFEHGASVLSIPCGAPEVAARLGIDVDALDATVARGRSALAAARARRVAPERDDKLVVAWNGLMISAYARAGSVLRDPSYVEQARRAADFILAKRGAGPLFRTFKDGKTRGPGFLDDHACFLAALLDLYEATFEPHWMTAASALQATLDAEFWDTASGGYFYTGRNHEELLARSRHPFDNATPAGNSVEVSNLLRLAALTGRTELAARAETTLRVFATHLRHYPAGMAEMLCALDLHLGPALQIALAADAESHLAAAVHAGFAPRKVVAGRPVTGDAATLALLADRGPVSGQPAAYVCLGTTCLPPETDPIRLAATIRRAHQPVEQ
jgi:hypothetical protein